MKCIRVSCFISLLFFSKYIFAQAGMTVSPGKIYYTLPSGSTSSQKVTVSNPNKKDLEVGVSINDWSYDADGNNQTHEAGTLKTSCADWIQIMPGSYFTLKPGEQKDLEVIVNVPPALGNDIPVHTAMLFLTQLNPGDSRSQNGSPIKVSVRMGVKLYHAFAPNQERRLEVLNFVDKIDPKIKGPGFLELEIKNTGKSWLECKIKWELINVRTGEKQKLPDQESYTLPGDKRLIKQQLPVDLSKGNYNVTAIVNYGNKDELKIVELEFER